MTKKIYLAILFAVSVYFIARLTMLFSMADKNHLFIYNNKDLDLMMPYADVVLTILFFFSFYHFFKTNRTMKYISIALMIFFIPFTILVSFLYIVLNTNDEHRRQFFNNEELLIVISHINGLHPDSGNPRDVYMYEKTAPFIYKKIGQSQVELDDEELRKLSDMHVDAEEPSVEINERRILLDKQE